MHRLEMKGWTKLFYSNGNQKKDGVAILISDKRDFKTKTIIRGKVGYYIMIKKSIQKEDIIFVNIYVFNIGAPKCKLIALKGFPDGSVGKESTCNAGDLVRFLGGEDPLEKG